MTVASSYNEGFDNRGHIRAPYKAFQSRTGHDPFAPSAQIAATLTHAPLGDRYSILPIPLVLDDREYRDVIVPGLTQRALALQALFFDLIRGDTRVCRHTSMPIDLFAVILEQEGIGTGDLASWWDGKSRESVRFTYGPDLVRGPDGRWLILEDNVGCVGGVVDSQLVVERFLQCTGAQLHPAVVNGGNLARAVCEFLARIERTPEAVLAVLDDECSSSDPETTRKRQALQGLGMRVFTRTQLEDAERRGLRMEDVGAIVNFSTAGGTPAQERAGQLFGACSVPMMMAPGLAALGNKALLPFMDEIVAFYASADPILRAAETHLCRAMIADPAGWVLKRSNGCQGREVFFLDRLSDVERLQLDARLAAWGLPEGAVLQRRVNASFVSSVPDAPERSFQVELRPFAFVIGDAQCLVGQHASGRAFRNTDGRGVGNMSQGACYLTVIREPTSSVESKSWTLDGADTRDARTHGAMANDAWRDPINM
jgi:uncharacterized circularly permuted ATP-grasp superfamily protein